MTLDLLIAWLCWAAFALSLWVLLDEINRCLPVRDPVRERREHEEPVCHPRNEDTHGSRTETQ